MKKYMIAAMIVLTTISLANAQYGNQGYPSIDDRYYYDNEFDWHWDIRVRISDGIQRGLITQYESNRLYRQLEDVERKEYAYQSDGYFTSREQQEVWEDVIYLNRRLGLELSDFDRNFYGFDVYGYDRRGYTRWFYQGGYDFYRFDKRGFGSIRFGYAPRPNFNGWFRHNNNRIGREYYNQRSQYSSRGNNQRDHDRGAYNNRPNSYPNQSGGYNNRPNSYPNQSRGDARDGYDNRRDDRPSGNDRSRGSQGNVGNRPNEVEPSNRWNRHDNDGGANRPSNVEPNNRSDRRDSDNGGRRPSNVEPNNRLDQSGQRGSAEVGRSSETPKGEGNIERPDQRRGRRNQ